MKYITLSLGMMPTNSYIVYDENTLNAAIIDPAADCAKIERYLDRSSLKLKFILLTHGHADHIGAVNELKRKTGAKLVMTKDDVDMIFDASYNESRLIFAEEYVIEDYPEIILSDSDVLCFDSIRIECIHTPGHTKGSCVYICDGLMFSGDTLFSRGYGRTDLYGGNVSALRASLERLYSLDENLTVLPGHMSPTTLDEERNLFI